tara:strand:- start:569 stop:1258 length:690 start_codon:yes stop_codon:yes gene_type:complete
MQLFYSSIIEKTVNITSEENKHLVKVLRKNINDQIHLIDGKGYLYTGRIIKQDKNNSEVEIINKEKKEKNHNYYLHVAISPTKNINRFEWFLEKATEIGIDEITPILSQRSERKKINIDRCERILISAIKQSIKFHIPKINDPISYNDFIKQKINGDKYIAHCLDIKKEKLENSINKAYTILIGPEGDFSEEEINSATNQNYKSLSLGSSRFRTETAGVISTHLISLLK